MKKMISVLLSVLMLWSLCAVAVQADDKPLRITVATDIHNAVTESNAPITGSTEDNVFGHVINNGKMVAESKAITTRFLQEVAQNDSDFLIITGDISDTGYLADEENVAAMLRQFEAETGKTVFCSMGNHETYGGSVEQFKKVYAELGYDKALAVDEKSASYTADLQGRYRLICIDTNNFDQDLYNWVEAQAKQAKADGKVLLSVTHFTLFSHYDIQEVMHSSIVNSEFSLPDRFIEWGIRFNFSGHVHELDIASYSNDNGTVYDIISGTTSTYPCCYRTVVFDGKNATVKTHYLTAIDTSLVPAGLCDTAADLLKNDFRTYAKEMIMEGTHKNLLTYYINAPFIVNTLGLNKEKDAGIIEILNTVMPRVYEAITMPLYGENSLETIANRLGYSLSKSEYKDALYVLCEVYAQHCAGDENCPSYSELGKLFVNALGTSVSYALEPLTSEQYSTLLTWALQKLNLSVNIPSKYIDLAAGDLTKGDAVRYLMRYAITPFVDNFTQDSGPADANATLPDYGNNETSVITLWEKIRDFFRTFLSLLHSFFTFFTGK